MTQYFVGRREIHTYRLEYDKGRAYLICRITDYWETVSTTTEACGGTAQYEVSRRVGVSHSDLETVKATIGGSLGLGAISQLKSSITHETQRETRWEKSTEEKQSFTFTAPQCGRRTNLVYQRIREYSIRHVPLKRVFRSKRGWVVVLCERLADFYVQPNIEPWIPECKCKLSQRREYDGDGDLDFGSVAMQAPYKNVGDEVEFDLPLARSSRKRSRPDVVSVQVPTKALPPEVPWLGKLRGDVVEGDLAFVEEDPEQAAGPASGREGPRLTSRIRFRERSDDQAGREDDENPRART